MIETDTHSIECTGYVENSGVVACYVLTVTQKDSGEPMTLQVEPRHLAARSSLKALLLGHRILYTATEAEHRENLKRLGSATLKAL